VSRLFISLYLDQDVSLAVAEMVRARGFQVATTHGHGRLGASDDDQLAFAVSPQMAIVTHNRIHFERLATAYFQSGETHSGIIIAVRRTESEIAQRLLTILNHITADEMDNQLIYI
jgi:hypothetical protein